MVVPLRKWMRRIVFLALFAAAAWILYGAVGSAQAWMVPNKYREPEGRSVKAFRMNGGAAADAPESALERLRLFYWYGE